MLTRFGPGYSDSPLYPGTVIRWLFTHPVYMICGHREVCGVLLGVLQEYGEVKKLFQRVLSSTRVVPCH